MKNKILFGVCILFGLLFINSGLNKFFNYMPMPKNMSDDLVKLMNSFMQIKWIFPLVAVAEIIGGILVMMPKYRALGAIIIFPINLGILLTHLINEPSGLILGAILFAINLWIIFENRQKYMPMIEQ